MAGIKSATLKIEGDYAFGQLRTETGVHRLVRKSPFDSARDRQLCQRLRLPEVDDTIEIEINPADVRIDTFRASGAGGQHINKTDSAVRMTHMPTGIVVQCQNDRSQHRNRDEAWQMLKSRLYEHEMRKREEQQKLEDSKTDVGWGHQIRSYVLDQSRIKDLRTNVEISNTQKVLDGDLDPFIEASLKQSLQASVVSLRTSKRLLPCAKAPPNRCAARTTRRRRTGSAGRADVRPGPSQDHRRRAR